jgi:regulatory protein
MTQARDPLSSKQAYDLALRWLAARELSEGQVRERLGRRGFVPEAINPAVQRLLSERALDNRRAAMAVARMEANVRRHGRRRIMAKLAAMRFDRDLAREVVQELFGETDETELLEQTLDKWLGGAAARLREPRERRKLVDYLVRQGFSGSAASGLIRRRAREK